DVQAGAREHVLDASHAARLVPDEAGSPRDRLSARLLDVAHDDTPICRDVVGAVLTDPIRNVAEAPGPVRLGPHAAQTTCSTGVSPAVWRDRPGRGERQGERTAVPDPPDLGAGRGRGRDADHLRTVRGDVLRDRAHGARGSRRAAEADGHSVLPTEDLRSA